MTDKIQSVPRPFAARLLIFLQMLLGVGAVFGGLGLIIDPGGQLIRMPVSFLEQSPFSNFLIPGIILMIMLGVLPLIVVIGLVRKRPWKIAEKLNIFPDRHWSWTYSFYTGFILIIWITLQVYFVQRVGIIHVVYIFWGLIIQALTILPPVQKYYSAKPTIDIYHITLRDLTLKTIIKLLTISNLSTSSFNTLYQYRMFEV